MSQDPYVVARHLDGEPIQYLHEDGSLGPLGPTVRRFDDKLSAEDAGAAIDGFSFGPIDAATLA